MSILPACMYIHHVCTWCPHKTEENIGSCYRGSWTAMWVMELEPRSSAIATSALNHWAISLSPRLLIKKGKGTLKGGSGLVNWGISPTVLWDVRVAVGNAHATVHMWREVRGQLPAVGFSCFCFVLFWVRVYLCNFGACPGNHFVNQIDLEITEIHQRAGIKGVCQHLQALLPFLFEFQGLTSGHLTLCFY